MITTENLPTQNSDVHYDFPYGEKIHYHHECIFLLLWTSLVFQALPILIIIPCKIENRFEPCNFKDKLDVNKILPLKKEMNKTQNAIDKLLSHNSQNNISIDETMDNLLETLKNQKEKLDYQKIHRTQCYIKNLGHERFILKIILTFVEIVFFGFGIFSMLEMFYYFIKSIKFQLTDDGKQECQFYFRKTLVYLVLFLIFSAIIVLIYFLIFINGFDRDKLENLPLFVVEKPQELFCFASSTDDDCEIIDRRTNKKNYLC